MATTRRTDGDILARVADRLRETPSDTARVGVSVRGGMVTLFGAVANATDRLTAREAAMRATGVLGVADEMEVREVGAAGGSDSDLAVLANQMLEAAADVPAGAVIASVRGNVLTLAGTVSLPSHRDAALRAVQHIRGVVAISNDIRLTGPPR